MIAIPDPPGNGGRHEQAGVWLTQRDLAEIVGWRAAREVMAHAHHRDRRGVRVIEYERAADLILMRADEPEVTP